MTPEQLHREIPFSDFRFIQESRNTIQKILNREDPRLLLIVGPCSIHDPDAAKEYAYYLKELSREVAESFFLVMRVYCEKPRTTFGWKGLLNDPFLDSSYDIPTGLRLTRQLLHDIWKLQLPTAAEILEPTSSLYYEDLLSWACIGARTASSQPHREIASGLTLPTAFKNTTDGNVKIAIQGIKSASQPHTYLGMDHSGHCAIIKTNGNAQCHLVLRGGETGPNYDKKSVLEASNLLRKENLSETLIVDCAHGNSGKCHANQISIFENLIEQSLEQDSPIRGIILESNLYEGNQPLSSSLKYGVSITDPCLSWNDTKSIILEAHERSIVYH